MPSGKKWAAETGDDASQTGVAVATLASVALEVPSGRIWLKDGPDADEPFVPVR